MHWRRTTSPHPYRVGTPAAATAAALLSMALTGCGSSDVPSDEDRRSVEVTAATATSAPDPGGDSTGVIGPEGSFRAWLAASRAPDIDIACSYLTPELVDRMVAEMADEGWPGITDCASMTSTTADLYAAVGASADASVEVRSETADRAELSVVYASGDCGTVVMRPAVTHWIITEQSQELC